jgi:hypothetical protein
VTPSVAVSFWRLAPYVAAESAHDLAVGHRAQEASLRTDQGYPGILARSGGAWEELRAGEVSRVCCRGAERDLRSCGLG